MHDGEHDGGLSAAIVGSAPSVLIVAATLAAVLVAGSVARRSPHIGPVEKEVPAPAALAAPSEDPGPIASTETVSEKEKRPKDRRRRGKDPLKELVKHGKKLKGKAFESQPSSKAGSSVDVSANHSRTPSEVSKTPPPVVHAPAPFPSPSSSTSAATTLSSSLVVTPAMSPTLSHVSIPSSTNTTPIMNKSKHTPTGWEWDGVDDPVVLEREVPDKPCISGPLSFSAVASLVTPSSTMPPSSSHPTTRSMEGGASMATSLSAGPALGSKPPTYPSVPVSLAGPASSSKSGSASSLGSAPSASTTGTGEGARRVPSPIVILSAVEEEPIHVPFPTLNPPPKGPQRKEAPHSPRRVPTPRRPETPSSSLASSSHSNPSSSTSAPPAHTASSGTGHPALSMQTQLASMRGALEAAKLREEKHKTELEKLNKDLDAARREGAGLRRSEMEYQTHIRQLRHQIQAYASLFATIGPHGQMQAQAQLQAQMYAHMRQARSPTNGHAEDTATSYESTTKTENDDTETLTSAPPNPPQSTSPPPQTPTPIPPHLQMLNFSSVGAPLSPSPLHSHHFAQLQLYGSYPPGGPPPAPFGHFGPVPGTPMHHPHGMSMPMYPFMQSPAPAFPTGHQPNPIASFTNTPLSSDSPRQRGGTASAASSSRAGSSAGSHSPDLDLGLTSPGRRRVNAHAHRRRDGDDVEGDLIEEDEDEEDGVSGFLADAILKRPGSLRVKSPSKGTPSAATVFANGIAGDGNGSAPPSNPGSSGHLSGGEGSDEEARMRRKGSPESDKETLEEFVFPSLSDLGNVPRRLASVDLDRGNGEMIESSFNGNGNAQADEETPTEISKIEGEHSV